ncbi:SMP-30/gluconolactonase/LRE family protein [Paraburkholderia phenazinium]|jgi:gluconolactonase|uniref:Gluconolactonase n=1 Tax=Paraburkholderia phenazinium TaxID=60549 RepID=A0A1N6IXG1_9BURK|nr:SMP-30/gluconolactonase/LRE family protein [Paraburkholderia phenazinium]SIO36626.1 gluconolactonase [Paraburkholderia phenazinium]
MNHSAIEVYDERARELLAGDAKLEQLASGCIWSEGAVWMHEDNSVLWSDIPNNRMMRWHPEEGVSVWRDRVEFTNGHYREADGSLLHCSHGQRAVIRTRFGPNLSRPVDEIVVDRYHGRRLNSPNDVVVKSDGTIWFSDPPYGILSDYEGHQSAQEMRGCHVFRFDPRDKTLDVMTDLLICPNGLAFSPDESLLYVSDTSTIPYGDEGFHNIRVFDVVGGRSLSNARIFATIADGEGLPDGFRLDSRGWVFTSSAIGIQVFHPDGTRLALIPVPEKVANLTFGGKNRDEMFIVASTSLYRLKVNAQGIQRP